MTVAFVIYISIREACTVRERCRTRFLLWRYYEYRYEVMSQPSALRLILGLAILVTTTQVARAQVVSSSVARLGSFLWNYEATGIYPPSYNLPAQVSIQVRIDASADSDTITGTGLWEITIYGNREADGSGTDRYDEQTDFLADDQRAQSFSPTDSLAFHQGTPFDLSGLACGLLGPYFCVEVSRAAGASMGFSLEPGKWVGCRSTPCYFPEESADSKLDVSFSDLQLNTLEAPHVPQDEPADLVLVITAVLATDSRRYLDGTGLWKVSLFGSKSTNGSGTDRYDERSQVLTTAENTDKSLQGQPLEMTIQTQFLLGGVGCEDYPYFCITIDKGDDPQPDFGIVGPITHCQDVECLYPDETPIPTARFVKIELSLELPADYPFDEPTDINLNVALTPSQSPQVPTSIIEGTDLWRLAIYGNENSDGSGPERFDERAQVLSDTDQDARLSPSNGLIFNVTTQFVIGRVGCDDLPYLCVQFGKGYSPVPDFVFDTLLIGCLEVPCTQIPLPVARLGALSFNLTNVGTGPYGEPVPISLEVHVGASQSATTDPILGSRLWQLSIYGSGQADGSGDDRFDQQSVLSKCQTDKSLLPGEPLQFEVDAEFIISGVGCYDYPYFCLKFEKGADPQPDFIMLDQPMACKELTCTPPPVPRLIVSGLSLQVKSGSPTYVKAGQDGAANYLKFRLEVIYDKRQVGYISGSGLWVVALWGSANADGSGHKVSHTPNTLRTLQTRLAVTLGNDFYWPGVKNHFDMTAVTCAEVRYICVKLSRGSVAADVYEFLTQPESYVPQTCVQMGCS
ncbi:uncharacterized protein LOC119729480 [Patiria miniata]|uniref:Uncharacterized protein n=1 Tax=Patiria miniata TaxID=46514 RepID=A0A914A2Z8_PATMI|nr:uncharacterized protein LOC119729480 [Patiria miniata]